MGEQEWKQLLTDFQFQVTRRHGTERAWTGKYNDHKEKGTYTCVCCGAPLFHSSSKYESGSGWPSFTDTIHDSETGGDWVTRKTDASMFMVRTEVLCKKMQCTSWARFSRWP